MNTYIASQPTVICVWNKKGKNMEVKEAVELAKKHISDLFEGENAINVGLEEVTYNDMGDTWDVTIGFSRPWDSNRNALSMLASGQSDMKRSYKTVKLSNADGKLISVKNRQNG